MALIINLILNRDTLLRKKNGSEILENEYKTVNRYRQFLFAATLYFISDIAWGFLYENRYISIVFTLLYLDTVLYFLLIYLTMLTWIRYIVAYLNKRGRKSKSLLYAAWIMFLLALIQLTVNFFYPFIFSFNENHDYVAEIGRHIAFFFHVALYIVTSTYMLIIAHKSAGNEKRRYTAVGFTCLVMELFAILQIFDAEYPSYALGLIIGISVIHSFVEAGERKEKEIYDNIAKSLSDNYEVIYYIDIKTDEFLEFSRSNEYASMNIPVEGQNFYKETLLNIEKYVHPDDKEFAKKMYSRETIFEKLKDKKSYSYKYRVMIYGHSRHIQFTVMFAKDKKHFILYEKDIEDEITAENMRLENQKMQITFTQIAEILAVNYDMIYYVDADNSNYISFESRNIYGYLKIQKSGDDFFTDSKLNISKIVHKNDQNLVLDFINKDYLNAHLLNQKNCHLNYRINTSKQTHFIRLTVQKTADGTHYIFLMENIDEEIQREKQHLKALNTEKELARRDELTGVKNKTAYTEMEKSVQANGR